MGEFWRRRLFLWARFFFCGRIWTWPSLDVDEFLYGRVFIWVILDVGELKIWANLDLQGNKTKHQNGSGRLLQML